MAWRGWVEEFFFVVIFSSVLWSDVSSSNALLCERLTPRIGFFLCGFDELFADDVEADTTVDDDEETGFLRRCSFFP